MKAGAPSHGGGGAPVPERRPADRVHHGDTFSDPYDWLRDPADPDVLGHLAAENAYCEEQTAHLEELVAKLIADIDERTQETDLSVPQLIHHHVNGRRSSYWYYARTRTGSQYPLVCRLPLSIETTPDPWGDVEDEEILIDGNVEAGDHEFFSIGATKVSPDGRLLAWLVDLTGDEKFTLHIRDLATGMPVDEPIEDVATHLAWAGSTHLFFTRHDRSRRPYQLIRHRVGTDSARDVVTVTEDDEQFWLSAEESRDRRWIIASSGSTPTTEHRMLSVEEPEGEFRVVAPRRDGVKYRVEVAGNRLLIIHNDDAVDFALAQAPLEATSHKQWKTLLEHEPGVRLINVAAYDSHIVVTLRREAVTGVHIITRDAAGNFGQGDDVIFTEEIRQASASAGPNYSDTSFRVHSLSFVTPPSVYNFDVPTRRMTLLKRTKVLTGSGDEAYDPERYRQVREWATAEDGTRIPISVVMRRDTPLDGSAPTVLYGYGAYETSLDPNFSALRISMLDRGFVYAIAHVRGGGELGRRWYLDGKLDHKLNSLTDFVACAKHLIEQKYTSADRLGAQGESAGGLLVAGAVNREPDLFRAVHIGVPFVDALTTTLDPDLPLTVTEWKEWGDPLHDAEAYRYIKSYSPYENIQSTQYPAMLVTASLNDTRVLFTEAAKLVAALRATTTNDENRPILLKTEMLAGHGGLTGRYSEWAEEAFVTAWLMDQLAPGPISLD